MTGTAAASATSAVVVEGAPAPARGRGRDALAIFAAMLAAGLVLSLRGPTRSEVRYLEACREMLATGDWIVPRLGYVPYFEKPILLYWLGAAAQALFGGSDVAGRLPSSLAAAIAAAVSYVFAASLGGRRLGLLAAGVLATSAGWLAASSILTTDTLLASLLWLAWWCWWRHDRGGRGWIWGFWAALGLAFMTKGPIALVFSGGGIGLYLLASRRLREAWRSRLILGPLLLLALNLPWTLLAWRRDPRFIEFFYIRENLKAFVDPTINHEGPLWLYPAVIALFLLPWTLAALAGAGVSIGAAARAAVARGGLSGPRDDVRDARLYLASLVCFGLLFLSVSASKLESYVLPLCPPIALLAAIALWRRPAWLRPLALVQAAAIALAALGGAIALPLLPRLLGPARFAELDAGLLPAIWPGLALMLAGAVAALVVARRAPAATDADGGRPLRALGWLAGGFAAALLVLGPIALDLKRDATAARLSRLIAGRSGPADTVLVGDRAVQDFTVLRALKRRVYCHSYLREIGMGHFAEVTPSTTPIPEFPYRVSAANLPQNPWLLDDARLDQAWRAGPCWFLAGDEVADSMRARGLAVEIVDRARSIALLCNPQAAALARGEPPPAPAP